MIKEFMPEAFDDYGLNQSVLALGNEVGDLAMNLFYTKEMQGSYSIKYVLSALFPDDKELNYANLEGVHNGAEASSAFKDMQNMSAEEVEQKTAFKILWFRYICNGKNLAEIKRGNRTS